MATATLIEPAIHISGLKLTLSHPLAANVVFTTDILYHNINLR
jgi:hypothetical protein